MIYYTIFANGCQVKMGYELWVSKFHSFYGRSIQEKETCQREA